MPPLPRDPLPAQAAGALSCVLGDKCLTGRGGGRSRDVSLLRTPARLRAGPQGDTGPSGRILVRRRGIRWNMSDLGSEARMDTLLENTPGLRLTYEGLIA